MEDRILRPPIYLFVPVEEIGMDGSIQEHREDLKGNQPSNHNSDPIASLRREMEEDP